MPKSRILLIVAVFSVLAITVFASTDNSAQIRKEYSGKQNTPDHVMFSFLLRATAMRYKRDKELSLLIVQDSMKLGPESAEHFLQRMLAAGEDLETTKRRVERAVLCQDNSALSKSNIYKSMDSLDDARFTISHYAYLDFVERLEKEEKENFIAWLDDAKEGYAQYWFDHGSLYKSGGQDVRIYVQQKCIRYAQEEIERAQQ